MRWAWVIHRTGSTDCRSISGASLNHWKVSAAISAGLVWGKLFLVCISFALWRVCIKKPID